MTEALASPHISLPSVGQCTSRACRPRIGPSGAPLLSHVGLWDANGPNAALRVVGLEDGALQKGQESPKQLGVPHLKNKVSCCHCRCQNTIVSINSDLPASDVETFCAACCLKCQRVDVEIDGKHTVFEVGWLFECPGICVFTSESNLWLIRSL